MRHWNIEKNILPRFFSFFELLSKAECWVWTGCIEKGYARFTVRKDRWMAHRFAYEIFRGSIPSGFTLDHLCRNRSCVNPWHLEIVSSKENTLRGNGPAAINNRKTHCSNGHAFTPENIYDYKGCRHCRRCRNERAQHYRLVKRSLYASR